VSEQLQLDEMQGLLLRGYGGLPHATFLLYGVGQPAPARAWLGELAGRLNTAAHKPQGSAINVALTVPGMRALGLPASALASFPPEVAEGMVTEHRSRVLGDADESAPEHWWFGGPGNPRIDLVVLAYAGDGAALAELVDELAAGAGGAGLTELNRLETSDIGRAEHFGFRDGISQPRLSGVGSAVKDATVSPGELVLGYPDGYGLYAARPLVAAADDPARLLPADAEGSGAHDLGRNGSYLVLRQLEQDVPAFWRYAAAQTDGEAARLKLAAKMVGRWPSGAPLVLSPEGDRPDMDEARLNAFRFHDVDADGVRCPVGAHIRRTNPRDSLDPNPGSDHSVEVSNHHRLLRRGRSYGPRLQIADALAGGPGADEQRGLYFMCLNTNLPRQFEFVQQTWVNSPKFGSLYDEPDPIVAPGGAFSMPGAPVRRRVTGVPRFVTVRGGAYFLLPSVAAVRYLAALSGGEPGNSS